MVRFRIILRSLLVQETYRPVLFHPEPLASADKISTKAQNIVDPGLPRCCTVICVVLDIQTNKGLRDTVDDGQSIGSLGADPKELHVKE